MPTPLTEERVEEIREIFVHFDKNGDGVIQKSEFAKLLEALGAEMSADEIDAGLRALDENQNGLIDFDEFLDWWSDRSG